jgi:uncharacterized protein
VSDGVDRSGHLPQPVAIESYGLGGFRFGGMSHRGSLLCLPSGMWGWDPGTPAVYDVATLAPVLAEADRIDILLVGTGRDLVPLPAALKQRCRELGISADPMATGHALRTWNVLLGEGRRVAAALTAVD